MSGDSMKKVKYSIHLGTVGVSKFTDILTKNAAKSAEKMIARGDLPYDAELYFRPTELSEPGWSKSLDRFFRVEGKIKSSSAAAVLIFRCDERVMACSFGHGHALLDDEKCENDFGLLIAANSLSDENVRLVEKANLGSVIRDATQAAGITRLQEFNVDRALSLVRRLSGNAKVGGRALSGASSITTTSDKDIGELVELGESLLALYKSESYKKTAFGIIDKIKPVLNTELINCLDRKLFDELRSEAPSFELGAPEIDMQPAGYMTIAGSRRRTQYPDLSLSIFLQEVPALTSVENLHAYRIVTHSVDGIHRLKEWTVYRGLVGSLVLDAKRYALNEGKWYRIDQALQSSANNTFKNTSKGLDLTLPPWPIVGKGRNGETSVYEPEEEYNKRLCSLAPDHFLLFDQDFVSIPNSPGRGVEICDILDFKSKRLMHIKKSGRRSSVISHFLMQGMNSAKLLRVYDSVRDEFFNKIQTRIGPSEYSELVRDFPQDWTIEFVFGDLPNSLGEYTIPFFSRVTLDEVKREIGALGFKATRVSFIKLSKPPKKQP